MGIAEREKERYSSLNKALFCNVLQENKVCLWQQDTLRDIASQSGVDQDGGLLKEPGLLCEAHHSGDVNDLHVCMLALYTLTVTHTHTHVYLHT